MQTEIVAVRTDYGGLILEWVIVGFVTLAVLAVILFAQVGVKRVSGAAPGSDWFEQFGGHLAEPPPDVTAMHRYLFACSLFGVVGLVFTRLYPPWPGKPLSDAETHSPKCQTARAIGSHNFRLVATGCGSLTEHVTSKPRSDAASHVRVEAHLSMTPTASDGERRTAMVSG
ncbi:MAG: hypothetical protein ACYDA9_01535 [Terriglobia bacterium]